MRWVNPTSPTGTRDGDGGSSETVDVGISPERCTGCGGVSICGETGRLQRALPAACPGCDTPREALGYVADG